MKVSDTVIRKVSSRTLYTCRQRLNRKKKKIKQNGRDGNGERGSEVNIVVVFLVAQCGSGEDGAVGVSADLKVQPSVCR